MYIRRPKWKSQNGKTYQSAWLCESYREDGKSKTRYLLNLGDYSESTLNALEYALKHIPELDRMSKLDSRAGEPDFRQRQGKSLGAVWAVKRVAEELGIVKALGDGREARLALWRIIAGVIDQGSRLSAARLHDIHALAETVGLEEGFSEDDLYGNLAWLGQRQEQIEASLFRKRRKEGGSNLYFYGVTSSCLKGEENAFAAQGHNRDPKKGGKRMGVGLLADARGDPVSVEVFRGGGWDFQTLAARIKETADRFGRREVTFVGRRGMIKSGQIEDLNRHGFHYLAALGKPAVERLVREGALPMSLFDEKIREAGEDGRRFIVRRNPGRAKGMAAIRKRKLASLNAKIEESNRRLREHPLAKADLAVRRMKARVRKLGMDAYCQVESSERTLALRLDEEAGLKASRLDGCRVIVTDLPESLANAETIHARYKDLARAEQAFRMSKTGHPACPRPAESVRGQVLAAMLSYLIRRRLAKAWAGLELTVENGLDALKTLCPNEITWGEASWTLRIPEPSELNARLLSRLNAPLPKSLMKNEAKAGMGPKPAPRRFPS
ncbi:MAG: transposase [Planctomycetota bacterium]|jgi:hypothetical protein|nr:transposase [Planctomycetota bacterium]